MLCMSRMVSNKIQELLIALTFQQCSLQWKGRMGWEVEGGEGGLLGRCYVVIVTLLCHCTLYLWFGHHSACIPYLSVCECRNVSHPRLSEMGVHRRRRFFGQKKKKKGPIYG